MRHTTSFLLAAPLLAGCSSPRERASGAPEGWTVFEWPEVVVDATPLRETEHGLVALDTVRATPREDVELDSLQVVIFDDRDGDMALSEDEALLDLTTSGTEASRTIEQGGVEVRRAPRLLIEATVKLSSGKTRSAVWSP